MNETVVHLTFTPFTTGLIAILATAVSTATMVGNIVVLAAFFVERSLRVPSNYFIASLAVTDVLIGLFSMNLFITYQLLGYWPLGTMICDLWLTLDFSACLTSQYTVFLITMDRFCSVKLPAKYRNWRTFNKVRVLICVSWILPASFFTPVILGWQKLTGEPPRSETKCDVSFTYYPVFNTTLTVGYFWTTLVVMCSLYVGIYKVARRLEKKSNAAGKRIAALFPKSTDNDPTQQDTKHSQDRADHENVEDEDDEDDDDDDEDGEEDDDVEDEDDEDERGDLKGRTKICPTELAAKRHVIQSDPVTMTAPDSGFRDSHSPADVGDEISKESLSNHSKKLSGKLMNEPNSDVKVKALSKTIDVTEENHLLCLPLNTCEGHVSSPKDIKPSSNFFLNKTNHPTSEFDVDSAVSDATCSQDYASTQIVDPLIHSNPKLPNHRPAPCPLTPTSALSHANPWDSSTSEFSGSLPSVNVFVPSPIVPISSPNQKLKPCGDPVRQTQTADPNDSPVWVRHKRPSVVDPYTCIICLQMMNQQTRKQNGQYLMNHVGQERACKSVEGCYCSMEQWLSKLNPNDKVDYSDYTTSTNESYLIEESTTECACPNPFRKLRRHEKQQRQVQIIKPDSNDDESKPTKLCDCLSKCTSSTNPEDECSHSPPDLVDCSCARVSTPRTTKSSLKLQSLHLRTPNSSRKSQLLDRTDKEAKLASDKRAGSVFNPSKRFGSVNQRQSCKGRHISLPMLRPLSTSDSYSRKHARKALRTISFILGAFMMCWIPYHIIVMIKGFCDNMNDHSSCVSSHLYNLSYWLCYMNSPINPFCYALSNALFRRTFFRILRGDFKRR